MRSKTPLNAKMNSKSKFYIDQIKMLYLLVMTQE